MLVLPVSNVRFLPLRFQECSGNISLSAYGTTPFWHNNIILTCSFSLVGGDFIYFSILSSVQAQGLAFRFSPLTRHLWAGIRRGFSKVGMSHSGDCLGLMDSVLPVAFVGCFTDGKRWDVTPLLSPNFGAVLLVSSWSKRIWTRLACRLGKSGRPLSNTWASGSNERHRSNTQGTE